MLALLRGAAAAGLLQQLATPVTESTVATRCGTSRPRAAAILGVLEAHDVVERVGEAWRLTQTWAALVLDQTPLRFEAFLGLGRVRAEQFALSVEGGCDYWQLGAADRLVVARGISPNPAVPLTVAAVSDFSSMEGVTAALNAGGRLLELGCGIGSRLCAVLLAYPDAAGVGIELDDDLVREGRRMAETLGLGARIAYVRADATTFAANAEFDLVQWSQFFFPAATRAAALAVALRALRPGGWISMPAVWDGLPPEHGTEHAHDVSAERLILDLWDVPLRSTAELADELGDAGFVDVHVQSGVPVSLVRGRRAP